MKYSYDSGGQATRGSNDKDPRATHEYDGLCEQPARHCATPRGALAAGGGGSFGLNTVGAAERAIPKFTRAMKSQAKVIAKGTNIEKVGALVKKFGGKPKKWKKMKTWDATGSEIHWHEHPGIGKVGKSGRASLIHSENDANQSKKELPRAGEGRARTPRTRSRRGVLRAWSGR